MDDRIRELDDRIKDASKLVDSLSALRLLNQASFDSNTLNVKQLLYYMGMVESLVQEKQLLMPKDESPAPSPVPSPPGNSMTLSPVLPLSSIASFLSSSLPLLVEFNITLK
jgi:hypothetical protein